MIICNSHVRKPVCALSCLCQLAVMASNLKMMSHMLANTVHKHTYGTGRYPCLLWSLCTQQLVWMNLIQVSVHLVSALFYQAVYLSNSVRQQGSLVHRCKYFHYSYCTLLSQLLLPLSLQQYLTMPISLALVLFVQAEAISVGVFCRHCGLFSLGLLFFNQINSHFVHCQNVDYAEIQILYSDSVNTHLC